MKPFTSFTALLTTSAFVAMTPMVAFANQEYLDAKKANCGNSTETRCGDWFYEYWYGKNQFEEYNCDAFLGFRRNDAVCNSPNMKIFEEVNSFGDFFLKKQQTSGVAKSNGVAGRLQKNDTNFAEQNRLNAEKEQQRRAQRLTSQSPSHGDDGLGR